VEVARISAVRLEIPCFIQILTVLDILQRDPEERYLAWDLACMVPLRDAPQAPAQSGRRLPPPVATNVAREGIKATNKVCELVTASVRNREEITTLVNKQSERRRRPQQALQDEDPLARDVLGMAMRRWGASWRSQVVFALLSEVASEPQSAEGKAIFIPRLGPRD